MPADTLSSGVLEGHALYCYTSDGNRLFTYGVGSSESLLPCSNTLGYTVCYPEVTEISSLGGWRNYVFTSLFDSEYQNEEPVGYTSDMINKIRYSTKAHYRGKLKRMDIYDSSGFMMQRTTICYAPLDGHKTFSRAMQLAPEYFYYGSVILRSDVLSFYKNYTYKLVERSSQKTSYRKNTGDSTSVITSCDYNAMGQTAKESVLSMSTGKHIVQDRTMRYLWETDATYRKCGCVSLVQSVTESMNGVPVKSTATEYALSESGMPYVCQTKEKYGEASSRTVYKCMRADKKGYPVFVATPKVETVYLWNADHSCPAAEIAGATLDDVSQAIGIDAAFASEHSLDVATRMPAVRKTLRNAHITEYGYIPHVGISYIRDASGKKTSYGYDNMGRLFAIYDNNGRKTVEGIHVINTSDNDTANIKRQLAEYIGKHVSIHGPQELHTDSVYTYWTGVKNAAIRYEWKISGDTADVSLVEKSDGYIRLKGHAHGDESSDITLTLLLYDTNGNPLGSKVRNIKVRRSRIYMTVIPLHATCDSVQLSVTVRSYDESMLYTAYLYCNGSFIKKITRESDEMYSRGHPGIRSSSVIVKRYQNAGLYQLSANIGGAEATREFTYEELFNRQY